MTRILLLVLLMFGLLGSSAVHLVEWDNWARNVDVIGPLFLVNVAAGIIIAAFVLVWRHWLPLLAAVGFGLATLGAYLLSATVGLFGHEQQLANADAAQVWGMVTDVACIVFAGLLLLRRDWRRVSEPDTTDAAEVSGAAE
jgi:hypothetical protein